MSDTPETDDQEDYGKNSEWAKFARKLERERNEAQIELQMWRDGNILHENHRDELEKTERERDEAKEALKNLKSVLDQIASLYESKQMTATIDQRIADAYDMRCIARQAIDQLKECEK